MNCFYEINFIISHAAESFSKSLEIYQPRVAPNYPTEKNLTSNISLAFKKIRHDGGNIFQEVPIQIQQSGKYNNHIDTFLTCYDYSVIIEAKNIWNNAKLNSLISDAGRIVDPYITSQVHSRYRVNNNSRKRYSLVVGQTMNQTFHTIWLNYSNNYPSNPVPFNNQNWTFHAEYVPYNNSSRIVDFWVIWALIEI